MLFDRGMYVVIKKVRNKYGYCWVLFKNKLDLFHYFTLFKQTHTRKTFNNFSFTTS